MAEARHRLGRQLTAWRDLAGVTQVELARRISYSRSAIANVEVGRDSSTRRFWQSADAEVGAGGALVAAFDQVHALARDFRRQTAGFDLEPEQPAAPVVAAPVAKPDGCECPVAVGRWTGRESRALREALRMTVSAFAKYLGVARETVSGWERRTASSSLSMHVQVMLDEVLACAGADAKTWFRLILDPADGVPHAWAGGTPATMGRVGRSR
ncbi:helix-turn-helix domain-containing protein [Micromonospora sp. CB01531]|uniref:helix-turn-helix domain-containing protein n=1 Tax=Micromonospora sp. CB01531 TaxID=1718947 RepID=UPI001F51F705|nr:helix-turn-helix domain-containing protein [Micromonospora sp. CB01531]